MFIIQSFAVSSYLGNIISHARFANIVIFICICIVVVCYSFFVRSFARSFAQLQNFLPLFAFFSRTAAHLALNDVHSIRRRKFSWQNLFDFHLKCGPSHAISFYHRYKIYITHAHSLLHNSTSAMIHHDVVHSRHHV